MLFSLGDSDDEAKENTCHLIWEVCIDGELKTIEAFHKTYLMNILFIMIK